MSARTGKLASSVRTIPIASVQLFVPENPRLIDVKPEGSNAGTSAPHFESVPREWGARACTDLNPEYTRFEHHIIY